MPELAANQLSLVVREGFERLRRYRAARALFIKDYAGQYMTKPAGLTGEAPINLIFLALRAIIPNLVGREGVNKVITEILAHREYAELLGLALNRLQKQIKLKKTLRAAIVDMCFGFATLKTGIAASGLLLPVGENIDVDPGQIYTDVIDLDDLSIDPLCTEFKYATFIGHNVRVARAKLLEANGWNEDLVLSLPSAFVLPSGKKRIEGITQEASKTLKTHQLQDYVYVVEVYIPEANTVCYIPNPYQAIFDDFLKVDDYYGPDEGPYEFGTLTPPIPKNPFPVAPVGVWRDLHDAANRIFKKFINQADRQKDVLFYNPAFADVADAVGEAYDGESIACADPSQVDIKSFKGLNSDNERMISHLHTWFNYVAGNPDQLAGYQTGGRGDTATEFMGLQANASVTLQDARDIIYDLHAGVSRKQAWFLHTDPLMFDVATNRSGIPLIKRSTGDKEVQIWLTPEQRGGDWLEFTFQIVKRSMQVLEPNLRAKRIVEFCTNIVPAAVMASQAMLQSGQQFDLSRYLMQVAEEMGIAEFLLDVFNDPIYQQRLAVFAQFGPKNAGKGQTLSGKGIQQNQGFPMAHTIMTPGQEVNQSAQQGAAAGQSIMRGIA